MLHIADQKARLGEAARRFLASGRKMLIDGQWVDAQSGRTIDVVDPATGLKLVEVPAGGAADVDRAVAAARRAPRVRGRLGWRSPGAAGAPASQAG